MNNVYAPFTRWTGYVCAFPSHDNLFCFFWAGGVWQWRGPGRCPARDDLAARCLALPRLYKLRACEMVQSCKIDLWEPSFVFVFVPDLLTCVELVMSSPV